MNVRDAFKEIEHINNLCDELNNLDKEMENELISGVIDKLSDYRFFLQRAIEKTKIDI